MHEDERRFFVLRALSRGHGFDERTSQVPEVARAEQRKRINRERERAAAGEL